MKVRKEHLQRKEDDEKLERLWNYRQEKEDFDKWLYGNRKHKKTKRNSF